MVEDKLIRTFRTGKWDIEISSRPADDGDIVHKVLATDITGVDDNHVLESSCKVIVEQLLANLSDDSGEPLMKTGFTKSIRFIQNRKVLNIKEIW